jgi:hypothetical protein
MLLFSRQFVGAIEYCPPSLCFSDSGELPDFSESGAGLDALVAHLEATTPETQGAEDGDGGTAMEQQDHAAGDDAGGDDGAPDEDQSSAEEEDEGDGQEPADKQPPIEPPLSWSKEQREHWAKLPRETQEYLHSREQQRDAEVRRSQNEAAEAKKQAEPAIEAAKQERQRHFEQLQTYIALTEALDPILAEGQRTDWVKLSAEDPAGAQMKRFAFEQRRDQLINAVRQRDAMMQQMTREHLANEGLKLVQSVPEWHDADETKTFEKARAGIDAVRKLAIEKYNYQPNEVAEIRDHRPVRMAYDLIKANERIAELEKREADRTAAVKAAEQKRTAPAPRLAQSSGQAQSTVGTPRRSNNAALRKIAQDNSKPLDQRVDAVMGLL